MMEELLRVKNLSIGIQRFHEASGRTQLLSSVEDISFNVSPGEIVGLVGESGSGKSLTALSIAGLLGEGKEVTAGAIQFGGQNLLALPETALEAIRGKDISMVFQEPFSSLNPLIKVGVQIEETLKLHGETDKALIRNRLMELMEKLRFSEPHKVLDAYPHRLSGGMCQRVMIALAVICHPRLLIADEPTTALDHSTQDQILALMKEVNYDLGTSILFISHDLSVIKSFCSRVLVMYSGRILEEAPTEDIFAAPAHEYTRCLLGSIPNRANRGKDLAAIRGRVPSLEEGRPSGCPFHPRCDKAIPECSGDFPPWRTVAPNHRTTCISKEGEGRANE